MTAHEHRANPTCCGLCVVDILGNSFVQGLPVGVRPTSVVLGGTPEANKGHSPWG